MDQVILGNTHAGFERVCATLKVGQNAIFWAKTVFLSYLGLVVGNLDVNFCSVFNLLSKLVSEHDRRACSETSLESKTKNTASQNI